MVPKGESAPAYVYTYGQASGNRIVEGAIVTNLASTTNSEGLAQMAAGREDGVLRIWP